MTKVLIITTIPGTIRSFLLPYVDYFRASGWSVDGMAEGITTCEVCSKTFDRVWDVDWSRNPFDLRNFLRAPVQLRNIVASRDFDLIHVHTPIASFVARYALRDRSKDKRPVLIYTAHGFHFYSGGNPVFNSFYLFLEKLAGRWTDYLVVMNAEDLKAARRHKLVPPDRLKYMPGIGVDTAGLGTWETSPEAIQRIQDELGLTSADKLFLMVAELIPRKRHVDAVRALAMTARTDVHLAFAGRGPLEERIRARAERLGIGNQVHFLGFRPDIPDLMRASDAVLLPSLHEGLPRSLMEALSLSVPCIGSDIRGTRDLLEGGCGLLFKRCNVRGLAQSMEWVLDHPEEVRKMAERGVARMKSHDLSVIIRQHEELYGQALAT